MNNKPLDLAEVIFTFLSKLPDTIRSDISVFVLIYGFDLRPAEGSELTDELQRRLLEPRGLQRVAAVIRSAASIDHVLARFVATEYKNAHRQPNFERHFENDPKLLRHFQEMKMGRKLRIRHAEAALQIWKALRDNELDPRSLMDFEDMQSRLLGLQ